MVAFKFKEAINVDELIGKQYFEYTRKVKKNNKLTEQIIKCKIKGLRSEALKEHLERKSREKKVDDDGAVLVKITNVNVTTIAFFNVW